METYKETYETWNKVASLYQEKFMDLDIYNETYDIVCSSITKQKAKILDIGCGPGNITKYLLTKRPDFDVFGIDIAPNMVALAKSNNPTANFDIMDSRHIDELKTNYDGIICGFCLPYISPNDCVKLIADCYRLLNDNGILYLSFVEGVSKQSGFQVGSSGHRVYFYYHQLEDIIKELIINEFKEAKVCNVDYKNSKAEIERHTIVIAEKKIIN